MPIFPGHVRHNNPNAPIVKLEENQVKGAGVFSGHSERNVLDASLRLNGYMATILNIDGSGTTRSFIYTNSDLSDTAWVDNNNWKVQGNETHVHTQPSGNPQATWTVNHYLNKNPAVSVVEGVSGEIIEGFTVVYSNLNTLTINFKAGGSDTSLYGIAHIN